MKGFLSVIIFGGAVYLIIAGYYGIAGVLMLSTSPVWIPLLTGLVKNVVARIRNIKLQPGQFRKWQDKKKEEPKSSDKSYISNYT